MEERHPFRIDFGDDPEVRAFVRHTYSIEGMQGVAPPKLTKAQLKKVGPLSRKFDALVADKKIQDWNNVLSYMAKHVTLVSGYFCGGTKFAANFLRRMNVLAGHEQIFSPDSKFYFASMVATQYDLEISGGISPWLASLKRPAGDQPIRYISIIRHPVDMINSRYYFNPPEKEGNTLELQRDILTQIELNVGMVGMHPAYVWQIENEEDQCRVLELCGRKWNDADLEKAREAPRNSKKKGPPIMTWDHLIEPLKDWSSDLGYDKKGLK